VRTIWKTDFALAKCEKCGRYFAPVRQLEHFSQITGLPLDHFTRTCVHCR